MRPHPAQGTNHYRALTEFHQSTAENKQADAPKHDADVGPIAISAASPFCRTSASNSPHSEAAIQSNLDLPHIGGNGGHRLAPARPPHLDLGRHGPERSR